MVDCCLRLCTVSLIICVSFIQTILYQNVWLSLMHMLRLANLIIRKMYCISLIQTISAI
uniref:Uncharacterized protein n=1 Tax=Amphimedon queenslandica TaxID=400682 RepID=A0A1X7VEZ5_AMPQE